MTTIMSNYVPGTWFTAISNSMGVKNVKIIVLHYLLSPPMCVSIN